MESLENATYYCNPQNPTANSLTYLLLLRFAEFCDVAIFSGDSLHQSRYAKPVKSFRINRLEEHVTSDIIKVD